jgi:hypothetical protein
MSLHVTFHRAASAEFIEASAWYETKRVGLALEFMSEIERCVSLASKQPLQFAIVREDIRRVVCQSFSVQRLFSRRRSSHRCLGGISWQQRSCHLAGESLTNKVRLCER